MSDTKPTFPRTDPALLATFDPRTKVCTMNCGPHRDDPRSAAERLFQCPECASAPRRAGRESLDGKYGEVLEAFLALMEAELHANAGKGDRPGWLSMTPETGMLEIYYHTAKLQKAVRDRDLDRIREHSADVANMSMMILDVCGGLLPSREKSDGAQI